MVSEPDPHSPTRSIIDPGQSRPIDPYPSIPKLMSKEPSSRRGVLGKKIPHRMLEGPLVVYKIDGPLHLLSIGFRLKIHLA